jgi:hypothetical protein
MNDVSCSLDITQGNLSNLRFASLHVEVNKHYGDHHDEDG